MLRVVRPETLQRNVVGLALASLSLRRSEDAERTMGSEIRPKRTISYRRARISQQWSRGHQVGGKRYDRSQAAGY